MYGGARVWYDPGADERKVVENREVADNVMLVGIVIPLAWDRSGRARVIALNTTDEHQFRIDLTRGIGGDLKEHIGSRIRVEGDVEAGGILHVARFIILDSFSAEKPV
jgi:hypothetical protein